MKKYVLPGLCAVMAGMLLGVAAYCGMTFLSCFMDGSPSQHPVAFPMSILGGIGCAVAVAVLIWRCIVFRKKHPSAPMAAVLLLLTFAFAVCGLLACTAVVRLFFQ